MSSEVPSPAGARRPAPRLPEGQLPWQTALYEAVRRLEARAQAAEQRAEAAERDRDRLFFEVGVLRQRLAQNRDRLDNWALRQQAWHRERGELLRRLGVR